MKRFAVAAGLILGAAMLLPAPAEAAGCLKGAAVGGVAGHYVGHHGWLGAAAGCLVGRHQANKRMARPDRTTRQYQAAYR